MKLFLLTVLAVCSFGQVFAAEPIVSAPVLSLVKKSDDGKSLEVQCHVSVCQPETFTTKVPETMTEIIDGKPVTKTVYKDVQNTRIVCVTSTALKAVALDALEVRSVKGTRYKAEDLADVISDKFMPVILVEREQTMLGGKPGIKVSKFNTAFLATFRPETLIIFMPPTMSSPAMPQPVVVSSPTPAPLPKSQ